MSSLTGRLPSGRPVRVTITDGVVAAVVDQRDVDPSTWLFPGLVDLQVNGFHGWDLNAADLSVETVVELVRAEWAYGVTTFCPTLITASEESLLAALSTIRRAREEHPEIASTMLRVHIEGPHISSAPGARGAHHPEFMRPPSVAEFDRWQDASGGMVGIVTVAPELRGITEYVRAVSDRGVVVGLGHCDAAPEHVAAAVQAGARLSTHLGNGTPLLHPRHPNHIWAQLAEDRLNASFIGDGHHLPADTLTVMLRAKGLDRSILISDSAALAGLPPGDYATPVGGQVTVGNDGRLVMTGSDLLAGSSSCLLDCLNWVIGHTEVSVASAAELATHNPARLMGWTDRGVISVGARADIAVLHREREDPEFRLERTLVAGSTVSPASAGRPAP